MRTLEQPESLRDASSVRRWLAERLEERGLTSVALSGGAGFSSGGGGGAGGRGGVCSTGWAEVDGVLGGGLRLGATHEWHAMEAGRREVSEWVAPLTLLTHLAWRGSERFSEGRGWVVWVGRCVWAYPPALAKVGGVLSRSVWVDAPGARERAWAVEAALRVGGLVVVADASGLSLAGSRRLQLSAESGGALGLLARPGWERGERSAAATRWEVRSRVGAAGASGWSVCLASCKGARSPGMSARTWSMERSHDGGVVVVPAGVVDGPVASSLAS